MLAFLNYIVTDYRNRERVAALEAENRRLLGVIRGYSDALVDADRKIADLMLKNDLQARDISRLVSARRWEAAPMSPINQRATPGSVEITQEMDGYVDDRGVVMPVKRGGPVVHLNGERQTQQIHMQVIEGLQPAKRYTQADIKQCPSCSVIFSPALTQCPRCQS